MLALTFFGLLHVPINVPALAFKTGEDNMDVNRELIAHGISNTLSGAFGSIQNYLVYTNSVIFIKSGGKSRMAGIFLAIATFAILLSGPGMIQYIPVMVVGILILVLGLDLIIESVWDTRHKLKMPEFLTVCFAESLTVQQLMGIGGCYSCCDGHLRLRLGCLHRNNPGFC